MSIALFFTVIGVVQAVLFKGRNPRRASIVTGAGLGFLLSVIGVGYMVWWSHSIYPTRLIGIVIFVVGLYTFIGAIFGYLAGGLIAGVFLLLNKLQPPLEDVEELVETVSAPPLPKEEE